MQSLYTRETLEELFRTKKPNLAPRSLTTYVNTIMRIQREIGQPTENELEEWLDGMKPTQARNFMTPIMVMYDGRHRRLFDKYNAAANSDLDQQRLSPSEMKHWVQKKSIKKMISRLREDCATHKVFAGVGADAKWRLRQMYVLWSIHYELPWRNILNACRIIAKCGDATKPVNYYCIREQSFLINEFKTKNVFKRHKYKLPLIHRVSGPLARLIEKHIGKRDNFLFCDTRGSPLSKNAYSNLLTGATKKYLAKRVGSSLWRHIYLTEWSRNSRTLVERREMAFRFHQTSLVTQMRYDRPEKGAL
jgi:hypothetical protein